MGESSTDQLPREMAKGTKKRKPNKNRHLELSAERRRLLNVLVDPVNLTIPVTKRCELAKINRSTYYEAIKDSKFLNILQEECGGVIETAVPALIKKAILQAAKGDFKFWAALMEMAGRYRKGLDLRLDLEGLSKDDEEEFA